MAGNVLLGDYDYTTLRIESREALARLGVPSNPAFTNCNIIGGLAQALGLSTDIPDEVDFSEFYAELFRDSLGELLGLELPPDTQDVVNGLRNISLSL